VYFVKKRTVPVKRKAKPRNRNDENEAFIAGFKNIPIRTAGIVAIMMQSQSFFELPLNLNKVLISFLVKIITAIKEAI